MIISKEKYSYGHYFRNHARRVVITFKRLFMTFPNYISIEFDKNKREYSETRIPGLITKNDGQVKCNSCLICEEICPSKCIFIKAQTGKLMTPKQFEIDFKKCIFCMDCIDVCPSDSLNVKSANLVSIAGDGKLVFDIPKLIHNNND